MENKIEQMREMVARGDGHVGTNITHLAPGIRGLPQRVKETGHLVVRGEAVISYADFEAYLAESQEDYANPRNLASVSRHIWAPGCLTPCDGQLRIRRP